MPDRQPISAVCALLELAPHEVQALVELGAMPKPSASGYDVVACVRSYFKHLRAKVPKRIEWSEAQRLYEVEDYSATDIAEMLGVSKQAVSQRAYRHGWVRRAEAIRAEAAELARKFIDRDADAIRANLVSKAELNRDLMALIRRHVDAMRANEKPDLKAGLMLRHLSVALKNIEAIDSSLVHLRDRRWADGSELEDLPELAEDVDLAELLGPRRAAPEDQLQ